MHKRQLTVLHIRIFSPEQGSVPNYVRFYCSYDHDVIHYTIGTTTSPHVTPTVTATPTAATTTAAEEATESSLEHTSSLGKLIGGSVLLY